MCRINDKQGNKQEADAFKIKGRTKHSNQNQSYLFSLFIPQKLIDQNLIILKMPQFVLVNCCLMPVDGQIVINHRNEANILSRHIKLSSVINFIYQLFRIIFMKTANLLQLFVFWSHGASLNGFLACYQIEFALNTKFIHVYYYF